MGSPKLLLQSGIGPEEHLKSVGVPVKHKLSGVGQNLQDHLDLFVICECTGDHTYDNVGKLHRTLWAGLQYVLFKSGPVASSLFETGGFWYADENARSADIQFHFGLGSGIEAGVAAMKNGGATLNSAYMRPRSRGSVRLASSNPNDAPLIDPNYWSDPYDKEMSLRGLRMAREIMYQSSLKPFLNREHLPGAELSTDEELFNYACANAKTDHHPVGTCRMGVDEAAVSDPDAANVCFDGVEPDNMDGYRNRTGFPPIGSDRNSRVTPPLACTFRPPHCEQHNASRDCSTVIVTPPFAYSVERYS